MVFHSMKATTPQQVEFTHLIECGLNIYGVVSVEIEVLGDKMDIGDFITESVGKGKVFVPQMGLVDLKVFHFDFQRFSLLHSFNFGSNRIDGFFENGLVTIVFAALEQVELLVLSA